MPLYIAGFSRREALPYCDQARLLIEVKAPVKQASPYADAVVLGRGHEDENGGLEALIRNLTLGGAATRSALFPAQIEPDAFGNELDHALAILCGVSEVAKIPLGLAGRCYYPVVDLPGAAVADCLGDDGELAFAEVVCLDNILLPIVHSLVRETEKKLPSNYVPRERGNIKTCTTSFLALFFLKKKFYFYFNFFIITIFLKGPEKPRQGRGGRNLRLAYIGSGWCVLSLLLCQKA